MPNSDALLKWKSFRVEEFITGEEKEEEVKGEDTETLSSDNVGMSTEEEKEATVEEKEATVEEKEPIDGEQEEMTKPEIDDISKENKED